MDFKTRNSSRKRLHISESVNMGSWVFILSRSIIPEEAKSLSYCVGAGQVSKGKTVPSAMLPHPLTVVRYYDPPSCLSCSSHHVLHVSASDRVGKRVYTESYFLHDCLI